MGWVVFILLDLVVIAAIAGYREVRRRGTWPTPIERPYLCDECGEGYRTSALMAMHHRAEHLQLHGPLKELLDQRRSSKSRAIVVELRRSLAARVVEAVVAKAPRRRRTARVEPHAS